MYSICEGEPELADTGISTHQVKHPLTSTIHSPFTGELKKISIKSKMCANEDMRSHYYITLTSLLHHIATPTQDSDTDGKYTLNKDTFVQAQKKQRKQTSRYTTQI